MFLHELRILPYQDPHQATKARAIYDTISWVPCFGPEAMLKPLWFFGQLLEDIHYGTSTPLDVLPRLLYTINNRL
ncbi:hypothetical protein RIEGSTA812A_PEG_770 [invertebrate metagenome]|uniref:Uncharacterized protein n=1 Tax=invertebrate metagenome TaxID=1711999 RepID=A0A484H5J4_9ZZZZ